MTDVDCVEEAAIDQADLLRYAEGPAPSEVAVHLEAHLEACAYCTRLLEEYRLLGRARRMRRRLIASGAAVGLIAAAAGVAALVVRPPPQVTATYAAVQVKGVVAQTMSADGRVGLPAMPWFFVPDSRVEIQLAPDRELTTRRGDVKMAVFVSTHGGALEAVAHANIVPEGDARFRSFRVRARGADLFGNTPGGKQLVFAFALDDGAFEDAVGLSFEEARARFDGCEWLAYDVIYKLE